MTAPADNPIYCALDVDDLAAARTLARQVADHVGGLKLGLEFFVRHGPDGVAAVMDGLDLPLFLDLKFHDIPNTVAGAVRSACALHPRLLTIHAAGGAAMVRAARAASEAGSTGGQRPAIIAVTVLTSLDAADLAACGVAGSVGDQVLRLAELALGNGADGLVCSPHEVAALRTRLGPAPLLVVPGIRPLGSEAGDQKRVMSPRAALEAGASVLVVGRPITQAPDPGAAARALDWRA